jgi:TusA-related sulfurtransferase
MTQQFQALKVDRELDTRGLLCPMPVIQASGAIKALASGQVLKILATDPGSKADLPAWAEELGHQLLRHEEDQGVYAYWVQKG